MLYSPNLYFFNLCKHSLYSVHTTQIPPKFFACSPPAIFHYTQEARTHQKCAKMSRNHVFLCHIDNVKNIKRDAAAKGEREKIAKTRQLIFFFFLQVWRPLMQSWKLLNLETTFWHPTRYCMFTIYNTEFLAKLKADFLPFFS